MTDLTDLNEVIEGLKELREYADSEIHQIVSPDNWSVYSRLRDLIDETDNKALALLKAQEPRVLTLEEVCNLKYDDVVYYQGINTNSVESAIVLHGEKMVPEVNTRVVQFRHAGGTGGWTGINNADLNGYAKKWRCWTSRPSEKQMRDTKWEGEKDAE